MNAKRIFITPRQTPRGRSGSSLVEVMAAMAGNMAIVALAVTSLVALNRADRSFRDRADARRMVSRFAEQLRDDVHAAEQLTWDEAKRVLRLTRPDGNAVVYQGKEHQWSRRLAAEDADGEGELAGAFPMPPRFHLEVAPENATGGDIVTMILKIETEDRPDDDGVAAEVTAVVGRDRRLLHQ